MSKGVTFNSNCALRPCLHAGLCINQRARSLPFPVLTRVGSLRVVGDADAKHVRGVRGLCSLSDAPRRSHVPSGTHVNSPPIYRLAINGRPVPGLGEKRCPLNRCCTNKTIDNLRNDLIQCFMLAVLCLEAVAKGKTEGSLKREKNWVIGH